MIKTIAMQYYRKHIDLRVDFQPGLNAVRAPVEAGKSTLLEAILYALFGAAALAETLDDVVTYGSPTSKLRVDLDFDFAGVDYHIYRGKSGAELTFGKERVTGQTAVTKFCEQLFGASAEMACRLMVAQQSELASSLKAGPRAAGEMIEYLADFDLLETIVLLIQNKLPSGNTATTEGRIASLAEQAQEVEVEDLAPKRQALKDLEIDLDIAKSRLADQLEEQVELDENGAKAAVASHERLSEAIAGADAVVSGLSAKLAVKLPSEPSTAALSKARTAVANAATRDVALKLHTQLQALDTAVRWDKDQASLEAEIVTAEVAAATAKAAYDETSDELKKCIDTGAAAANAFKVTMVQLGAKLIKETSCALCQKDLSDVPEVVKINAAANKQIEGAKEVEAARLEMHTELVRVAEMTDGNACETWQKAADYVKDLREANLQGERVAALYSQCGVNITVDPSTVPAQWTWVGPTEGDEVDHAGALATLEQQVRDAVAARAARAEQEKQLETKKAELDDLQTKLAGVDLADAQDRLTKLAALVVPLQQTNQQVANLGVQRQQAESSLATAEALQKQAAANLEQAKANLKAAAAELDEMQANNALIKKVRAARPQITDQLWAIVLAAVSKYFTEIRGEVSIITRADNVFKVNGNPVAGLSGSAKDALGLAIRVALVKTFLPVVDFAIFDEPTSACSEQRATAMLGFISTAGFGQVILVSHSDLAESVADNLIVL